jgi:hypothetical protein
VDQPVFDVVDTLVAVLGVDDDHPAAVAALMAFDAGALAGLLEHDWA